MIFQIGVKYAIHDHYYTFHVEHHRPPTLAEVKRRIEKRVGDNTCHFDMSTAYAVEITVEPFEVSYD